MVGCAIFNGLKLKKILKFNKKKVMIKYRQCCIIFNSVKIIIVL